LFPAPPISGIGLQPIGHRDQRIEKAVYFTEKAPGHFRGVGFLWSGFIGKVRFVTEAANAAHSGQKQRTPHYSQHTSTPDRQIPISHEK
jgi:hypothetical protein